MHGRRIALLNRNQVFIVDYDTRKLTKSNKASTNKRFGCDALSECLR